MSEPSGVTIIGVLFAFGCVLLIARLFLGSRSFIPQRKKDRDE